MAICCTTAENNIVVFSTGIGQKEEKRTRQDEYVRRVMVSITHT